jgi:hypothetical protein
VSGLSPDSASLRASEVLELGSLSVIFIDWSITSTDLSSTCGPVSLDATATNKNISPVVPNQKIGGVQIGFRVCWQRFVLENYALGKGEGGMGTGDWGLGEGGLGIGDWGLGAGDWGLGESGIPNSQSQFPIPNSHSQSHSQFPIPNSQFPIPIPNFIVMVVENLNVSDRAGWRYQCRIIQW